VKLSLFILLFTGLAAFQDEPLKVVDYNELEPYLHKNNDTCYVINFWATWCGPCVKEIPYYEQITRNYANKKVKVILVSLDFAKTYKEVLIPFIEKRNLKSEILLLNDPNSNEWIDKIDKDWTGSIPATLVYTKTSRSFYEKSFTYNELDSLISHKLSKE